MKLNIAVTNWDESEDTFTHVSQWALSKNHQKILHSILRQLFEHPNTKYSSRLKILGEKA